jgi:hypothetical protein
MKSKTFFIILLLSLFPLVCPAEILIYKGSAKSKAVGAFNKLNSHGHVFWVHDVTSGVTTQIYYGTYLDLKSYNITDVANRTGTVHPINGTSFTVLTKIKSGTDTNGIFTSQAVWIRGVNTTLKVSNSTTKVFPRRLTLHAKDLQVVGVNGLEETIVSEGNGNCIFMSTETITANESGETQSQAIARLSAEVEALGYIYNGPPYNPAE